MWLVGIWGFLGCEITEIPIARYPYSAFLLSVFARAAFGKSLPYIEEKFIAQLSKKFPFAITCVMPPPPSGLVHSSRDTSTSFESSKFENFSIM